MNTQRQSIITDIKKEISELDRQLQLTWNDAKNLHSGYICLPTQQARRAYERIYQVIENKRNKIDESKKKINECIKGLEGILEKYDEFEKLFTNIREVNNESRIGTLQGLCRDTIIENQLNMDEDETTVFEQHYDEKEEIKKLKNILNSITGGKKRKNTKRKDKKTNNKTQKNSK